MGAGCAGWLPARRPACVKSLPGPGTAEMFKEVGKAPTSCRLKWALLGRCVHPAGLRAAREPGGTSFPAWLPGRCGTGQPGSEPSQRSSVQSVRPDGAERRGAGVLLVALAHPSSPVLGHRGSWCSAFGLRFSGLWTQADSHHWLLVPSLQTADRLTSQPPYPRELIRRTNCYMRQQNLVYGAEQGLAGHLDKAC